jgi:enamine deaminase RidA (YjgF/YER057c/UK114 family)
VEQGYKFARYTGLNLITTMRKALGDLDRVKRVVKVLGMVCGATGFTQHPKVIDGCTDLFVQVWGDAGRPARSAVGMHNLPNGIPVEIEAIIEVE